MHQNHYKVIKPGDIRDNVFQSIGKEWMLITAGGQGAFNSMTASWGAFGVLWHLDMAICFVRPQRYTYEFIEKQELYSLSFFGDEYKDQLKLCGTKSGRDIDKVRETGFTPAKYGHVMAYKEARLVVECQKIYTDFLKPELILEKQALEKYYQANDYHKMYIGKILNCYTQPD